MTQCYTGQLSVLLPWQGKAQAQWKRKGLDLPQLVRKVSHRQGELQLQPPAQHVRGKAHPSSAHHPQSLPVSHAVVFFGTTKSEYHAPSLKSLHSPHIPKELRTAASPASQERSGGTEMSPVTSSVSLAMMRNFGVERETKPGFPSGVSWGVTPGASCPWGQISHSKRCSGSGKTLRNHSSLGSVTFGNSSIVQQKLLSLHLSCLERHLRRQISAPRGHVTAQFSANHVTACFCLACVRRSNPCYSSEDKFLAETEFDLMYSSSNDHCCSRSPGCVQFSVQTGLLTPVKKATRVKCALQTSGAGACDDMPAYKSLYSCYFLPILPPPPCPALVS